ncbi:MAG: circularly permuted type 2 ATP-grasp protein [Verrucomicrobiota bacterium]
MGDEAGSLPPVPLRETKKSTADFRTWNETFGEDGAPREMYRPLYDRLDSMSVATTRTLDEQLEATMREMGVTFDIARDRPWGRRPWFCDLLPQIFTPQEWEPLVAGIKQRLRAFELFLQDVYSKKRILRSDGVPIQPVLGSAFFRHAAANLPPPGGAYLHLSGISVCRLPGGEFGVKHHYFSNASGMSYMIQNRRALARVIPQSFQETSIHSIADVSTDILEMLRSLSGVAEPTAVLLSPGPGSPVYSEHSFLARRMGIPLVQGGDLLVLNDAVYLKTVSGLEKVEIIYSRVSDQWLDPIAFRRDSMLGVPGLVHCIRRWSLPTCPITPSGRSTGKGSSWGATGLSQPLKSSPRSGRKSSRTPPTLSRNPRTAMRRQCASRMESVRFDGRTTFCLRCGLGTGTTRFSPAH